MKRTLAQGEEILPDDVHVAIVSYKRAGQVDTIELAPFAYIWVPESQGQEYWDYYPGRVITIPDELDGNLCRKRNAVLNLLEEKTGCTKVAMMNDDLRGVGYWHRGIHRTPSVEHLAWFIANAFRMAEELGTPLWGLQQNRDEMLVKTQQPFNLLSPVLDPFCGHIAPSLRYDENIPLKGDYDFWMQTIRKHRKTLRFNFWHYMHAHGTGKAGGLATYRSKEREFAEGDYLSRKWGKLYRIGGTSGGRTATGKNFLNSRATVPIPGC